MWYWQKCIPLQTQGRQYALWGLWESKKASTPCSILQPPGIKVWVPFSEEAKPLCSLVASSQPGLFYSGECRVGMKTGKMKGALISGPRMFSHG